MCNGRVKHFFWGDFAICLCWDWESRGISDLMLGDDQFLCDGFVALFEAKVAFEGQRDGHDEKGVSELHRKGYAVDFAVCHAAIRGSAFDKNLMFVLGARDATRQIFAQQRSGLCAMVGAARKMFLVLLGPCAFEVCEKGMRKVSWPVVALTGHMFISIIPMSLAILA